MKIIFKPTVRKTKITSRNNRTIIFSIENYCIIIPIKSKYFDNPIIKQLKFLHHTRRNHLIQLLDVNKMHNITKPPHNLKINEVFLYNTFRSSNLSSCINFAVIGYTIWCIAYWELK
jgi:hypothetical protein